MDEFEVSTLEELANALDEVSPNMGIVINEGEKLTDGSTGTVAHIPKSLDPWELVSAGAALALNTDNIVIYDGTNDDVCVLLDI